MRAIRVLALLPLLALLAPAPSVRSEPSGEWVRPFGPMLPGTTPVDDEGDPETVAVRVLTRDDGRLVPVKGALVSCWSEDTAPSAVASQKLGEGRTSEHGFANVAWPEGTSPFHWVVEAEGHAVWHDAGIGDEVVLERSVTKRFRVLGPLGSPLAGARVEVFHGCPHSPALRTAISDGDGLVSLEGVAEEPECQIWIDAEGAGAGPHEFPVAVVGDGDGPPTLVTAPGRTASGVVLDVAGQPLAGIVVREIGYPRGPVTTTDARGRFTLHGLDGEEALGFFHPDGPFGERPSASVEAYVDDVLLRIVLRRDRPHAPGDGEVRHPLDVEVRQRWKDVVTDPLPVGDGVPVTLVRLADGLTFRGETGRVARGYVTAHVPPGEYRIIAGGGFSSVARGVATARVPSKDPAPVRLDLDEQPTLSIRDAGFATGAVTLRIPGAARTIEQQRWWALPADAPAAVHIEGPRPLVVPVGPVEDGRRNVTIPRPAFHRIRVRVRAEERRVGPEMIEVGWEEGLWDAEPELGKGGIWTTETQLAGRAVLRAEADGHETAWRVVDLPTTPREIDMGEIVLRRSRTGERTFRIADADGNPVPEVEPERAPADGWGNEPLDDDGRFTVEVGPRPEPWIVLSPTHFVPRPGLASAWFPLRFELSLASSADIRFPAGRITVLVRDDSGRPLPAVGYLNAVRIEAKDGELDLRGVPDGTYTLIVGSRGRLGEVRRIVLRKGEHRRFETRLPPRK